MANPFYGLVAKTKGFFGIGSEGMPRGPITGIGEFGTPFILGGLEDGWQRNISLPYSDHTKVSIVYSCVQAYSRAVSTCQIQHITKDEKGRHNINENSLVSRLLRNPNPYETWCQFIYNVVAELGFRGASLAVIVRDNRYVPIAFHRIPHGLWGLFIDPETKEIFYSINSGNNLLLNNEAEYLVPARDVVHFRQHTPRHPLIGESPVAAAALAVGINVALSQSQAAFFSQMRRPSGVLTTEKEINKDQITRLREAFDEQAKRWAQGGMPILSHGLKFQPLSISSVDAQLIDAQKLTKEDICGVFAVPPPVVSILSNATFNNSETLLNHWLSTGLGSTLENLEQSLNNAFGFDCKQYINFNTDSLQRIDAKTRIETLAAGIKGSLYTSNEARRRERLPDIEGGDTVFMQMQNFPINLLTEYASNTVAEQMNRKPPKPDPVAEIPEETETPPPEKTLSLVEPVATQKQDVIGIRTAIDGNKMKGLLKQRLARIK